MKKKVLSIIMILCMLLAALPATAFSAVKYNIWVGGVQVTSANAEDVFRDGTVSYDGNTNTLTLNEAEILEGLKVGDIYCGIYTLSDLKIELKGKTRIYLEEEDKCYNGIKALGDIEIKGNGELHVRARGDYAKGIWTDGEFSVGFGALVYSSGLGGEKAGDSGAVWAKEGIIIADGMVESFEYAKVIEYYDENEKADFYVFSADKKSPSLRAYIEKTPVYYSGDVNPNDAVTMHKVLVMSSDNGTVKTIGIPLGGSEVRLEFAPKKGSEFKGFTIWDTTFKTVEVKDRGNNVYSFTMPKNSVYVNAEFVKVGETNPLPYTDVNEAEWYGKAIRYAYENGLVEGAITGDKFGPGENASRAMIIYMLWKAEGMPLAADAGFSDVKVGDYFKAAVDWAKESGISVGYGSTFGAYDNVTREQMVTILYRYAIYKGADVSVGLNTNILSYNDAFGISEYAIPAMQWACGSGVISGDGANLFPQGYTTKAQLAQVIMMLEEKI